MNRPSIITQENNYLETTNLAVNVVQKASFIENTEIILNYEIKDKITGGAVHTASLNLLFSDYQIWEKYQREFLTKPYTKDPAKEVDKVFLRFRMYNCVLANMDKFSAYNYTDSVSVNALITAHATEFFMKVNQSYKSEYLSMVEARNADAEINKKLARPYKAQLKTFKTLTDENTAQSIKEHHCSVVKHLEKKEEFVVLTPYISGSFEDMHDTKSEVIALGRTTFTPSGTGKKITQRIVNTRFTAMNNLKLPNAVLETTNLFQRGGFLEPQELKTLRQQQSPISLDEANSIVDNLLESSEIINLKRPEICLKAMSKGDIKTKIAKVKVYKNEAGHISINNCVIKDKGDAVSYVSEFLFYV